MIGRTLALLGIAVVLGFYAELLAHAPATGQDFRLFYAAASVLRHGGNPYDTRQLYREEVRLYHPTTAAQRQSLAGNPLPEGPPLVIALMPAVGAPPSRIYLLYASLLAVAAAAALAIAARLWSVRRPLQRITLGLLSPVTFLGVMLGQPDALFLLAIVLALWLLRRERVELAGFVLAIGLVKPQIIAGPIVLLGLMALRERRLGRYAAGVVLGSTAFVGVSVANIGLDTTVSWLHELIGFGRSTVYTQVDISSLSTLYLGWAPHTATLALTVLLPIIWLVSTARMWRSLDHIDIDWCFVFSLTLWLLVTPYAHPHDDVLLLPAVWWLLDLRRTHNKFTVMLGIAFLAAWWLLPMTNVLGLRPPLLRGVGIVPVLLLALTLLRIKRLESGMHVGLKHEKMAADAA